MELLPPFVAAMRQLIGEDRANRDRFGIAVSGGPDSLALLLLANTAFPGRIAVATVDHGLRPESTAEALLVADCCADVGVPHKILHPVTPITGSLQTAARSVRYALLNQWSDEQKLDWLLTGHHADDQLETMLMRLNRASGVAGLAAIRGRQGRILRPMLGLRRADLAAIVTAHGWTAIDDPSNRDDRFDRARMRRAVAALGDAIDPQAAAGSAAALDQADQALTWMTDQLANERISRMSDGVTIARAGLPAELVRRLLQRALAMVDATGRTPPRGDALTRAIAAIANGQTAMIGDVILTRSGEDCIVLRQCPPRRSAR